VVEISLPFIVRINMSDTHIKFEESILTVNILRNWDRDKIERFAKHLLGSLHNPVKPHLIDLNDEYEPRN
jgi:hypothetical protein